jgi:hypothetical protein
VERRGEVGGRHHAREHLDRAHRVGLRHSGHGPQVGEVELAHGGPADLLEADPFPAPVRLDGDPLELERAPLQPDLQLDGLDEAHDDFRRVLGIPQRLDAHRVRPGRNVRNAEGAGTVRVGRPHGAPAPNERDGRAVHCRPVDLAHPTLDGPGLSGEGFDERQRGGNGEGRDAVSAARLATVRTISVNVPPPRSPGRRSVPANTATHSSRPGAPEAATAPRHRRVHRTDHGCAEWTPR